MNVQATVGLDVVVDAEKIKVSSPSVLRNSFIWAVSEVMTKKIERNS